MSVNDEVICKKFVVTGLYIEQGRWLAVLHDGRCAHPVPLTMGERGTHIRVVATLPCQSGPVELGDVIIAAVDWPESGCVFETFDRTGLPKGLAHNRNQVITNEAEVLTAFGNIVNVMCGTDIGNRPAPTTPAIPTRELSGEDIGEMSPTRHFKNVWGTLAESEIQKKFASSEQAKVLANNPIFHIRPGEWKVETLAEKEIHVPDTTPNPTAADYTDVAALRVFRLPDDIAAILAAFPDSFALYTKHRLQYLKHHESGECFTGGTSLIIPTGDTDLSRMVVTTTPYTQAVSMGLRVLTPQLHEHLTYSPRAKAICTVDPADTLVRLIGLYVGDKLTGLLAYDAVPGRYLDLIDPKHSKAFYHSLHHLTPMPPVNTPATVEVKLRNTVVETIAAIADVPAALLFAKLTLTEVFGLTAGGYIIKCPSGVLNLKVGTTIILNTDPTKEPVAGVLMG